MEKMSNKELMDLLGKNVKFYRERKKWTQEELAEKADLSKNMIYSIEKGIRSASTKTLFKLSDALDIEIYKLITPKNVWPANHSKAVVKSAGEVAESLKKLLDNLNLDS